MNIHFSIKGLKCAYLIIALLFSHLVYAQNYFISHKPTGFRMHTCALNDGAEITTVVASNSSICTQWQRVAVGDFFFIKNANSQKHIRPDTADNGSPIVQQPNTWTGNWTQWSYLETGDGFGYLVNRATQKIMFAPGPNAGANVESRPASWSGDYTRWAFQRVTSEPTMTATPTMTVTATPTMTATPTPAVFVTKMEAEDAVLSGSARSYDDMAASGGEGIAFIDTVGDGISFTNVQKSDAIRIRYAAAISGKMSIVVNGTDSGDVSFSSTGDWTNAYNTLYKPMVIPENATVELIFDNGDAAMNIDYLEFSFGEGTPTPTPTIDPSQLAKYEPQGDAILVFVGQDNDSVGGNANYSNGYVDNVGVPAGITHYVYFTEGATNAFGFTFDVGTVDGLSQETTWGAGPMCMKCYVDSPTLQNTVMHLSISMEFNSEDQVASGQFDHLIDELAQFLKQYENFPFLIRIGYEFDGPWNGYDAANYKAAFIRIVDGLRAAEVTNYATVMASSSMFVNRGTWDAYWPGDNYVDWVGYSYFGGATSNNADALNLAREKSKPIFIAEAAPRGSFLDAVNGNDVWNNWFSPILSHAESNKDVVKAISYISADWDSQPMWRGNGWGDTRIHINSVVNERWLNKMDEPLYIHGTDNVYDLIQFAPAAN